MEPDWQALRDGLKPLLGALNDEALDRDRRGVFSHEKWKLLAEAGLFGLPFPAEYGGLDQDLPATAHILEGLGFGCRDGGLAFSAATHLVGGGIALWRFGGDRLKERYLPGICAGTTIGAHAISEPDHGSDAMSMTTRAERDGDHWVLTGAKTFVSNAPVADLFTVYARTRPGAGPLGVSVFLVERDAPGLSVGRPLAKMGLKTSPTAELALDGVRVPADRLIGRPGAGLLIMDHVMTWEILCSFSINLGEMRHRLERCLDYAKTRMQFGRPIGGFQAVAHKIVEMKIGVETSAKWLHDTALRFAAGEDVTSDLAITKLVVSEANLASALTAVQIFGGNGYMAEFGLEKDLRDAVGGVIYSGTSDIQRNRVASLLGLPYRNRGEQR
ncbi:acyl-CoA dehydrogenase family protein [Spongiactinospora sp. 9N601]|uniref:acyl-CoA dehydrogenase family protein n=1 Tax=Spongiactinospora sp. 9N601 TaxID=3375149 RepID=UPI0037B3A2CC